RHTRFSRDWSSDVCSSDLSRLDAPRLGEPQVGGKVVLGRLDGAPGAELTEMLPQKLVVQRVGMIEVELIPFLEGKLRAMFVVGEIGRASCREREWESVGAA